MKNLEKAFELMGTVPLPANAEEQLEKLYDGAKGQEQMMIGQMFEALFVELNDGTA